MAAKIANTPYVKLEFDKAGKRLNSEDGLAPPGCTDLVLISHGWHSDADESQRMYEKLFTNLAGSPGFPGANRNFAVAGVFWPSDKFSDDLSQETKNVLGGVAAAAGGDLAEEVLSRRVGEIAVLLDLDPVALEKMVLRAKGGLSDADKLVDFLRNAVGTTDDNQIERDHKDLMTKPGREILAGLEMAPPPLPPPVLERTRGGAAGEDADSGGAATSAFTGVKAGLAKLLNQIAYYELKKRAGQVGERVGELLNATPGMPTVRVHLVGHSFGARLVTSAARKLVEPARSLTLLQAAFSHNSFCDKISYPLTGTIKGGFRDVIVGGRINGPIAITHTWNDKAVGLAYPSASRIGQQVANAEVSPGFGGEKDAYGALGANGALGMPATEGSHVLYSATSPVILPPGKVTSIRCDAIENHNDVSRHEVARILAAAVA